MDCRLGLVSAQVVTWAERVEEAQMDEMRELEWRAGGGVPGMMQLFLLFAEWITSLQRAMK